MSFLLSIILFISLKQWKIFPLWRPKRPHASGLKKDTSTLLIPKYLISGGSSYICWPHTTHLASTARDLIAYSLYSAVYPHALSMKILIPSWDVWLRIYYENYASMRIAVNFFLGKSNFVMKSNSDLSAQRAMIVVSVFRAIIIVVSWQGLEGLFIKMISLFSSLPFLWIA